MYYILIIIVTIGKYDEALFYYQETLDARRILGNTHPDTLVFINEIGNVLKAQAVNQMVFQQLWKCLTVIADEALSQADRNDINTYKLMNALGWLLQAQGAL